MQPKEQGAIGWISHFTSKPATRNIWRAYSIAAGQDLFGDWIVVLTYGRIGARGRTKTVVLPDETETRRYVRQCLKKRENAPKRIGIGYKVIQTDGMWEEFIEPKSP